MPEPLPESSAPRETMNRVYTFTASAYQMSMPLGDEEIQPLLQALQHSPDNIALKLLLARTFMKHARHEEAETHFRGILSLDEDHLDAKLGLANAFFKQSKQRECLALVETLLAGDYPPPQARALHAKLLERAGKIREAIKQYREAISDDPTLQDEEFEERNGVGADPSTSEVVDGRIRNIEDDDFDIPGDLEKPVITFDQVGGMDAVKEEIEMKIIHPLNHPEIYKAYGKPIGGGILLYGPPGCGKTHLARATAGQANALFLSVGISDVVDMWIGSSEKNLHALFQQGRSHTPCVMFFDEVDALGASRSDMRQSAGRNLINQFLSELDGIESDNDGLLILAATNAPWHLDAAFRRPGRFDRIIFVPPPDTTARAAILSILLTGKPVAKIDPAVLAKKTQGFSGADLKSMVDIAIEGKLREAMKSGTPEPLSQKDLLAAAKKVKPSTKEWFSTARNHALYANEGGLYDDILEYLNIKR